MKVVRRTGTSADPEAATEYIYRISEFTRGTVTDKDFEITFPSGTDVVDEIAMVAYRVLPSGVHMLALVNPATGKSTIPEDTSIDDAIKDARKTAMSEKSARNNVPKEPPANQATQKPNVPASPHQVSASVTWFWIGIVILAIGTLSLIIGVKNFKAFRAIKKGS